MKTTYLILTLIITLGTSGCYSQDKNIMKTNNNSILCNPASGICELPADTTFSNGTHSIQSSKKPVKIIYFTDPICSSCWGIEPQLRKLKLEYGNTIEIEYRMGGLLPNWSYNSGGISKPSDVAHHWNEVSLYYDMPIDGNIWLEDPLQSSYPPSIAFIAAQIQDKKKAILFLREIREMVFLQKKNITSWQNLELAAKKVGLDLVKFKTDYEGRAIELFEEDLKLGRKLGVRGFPTMFFTDSTANQEIVYGSQPYTTFEKALLKLKPSAAKIAYDKTWSYLFAMFGTLTAKEFSVLTETPRSESEKYLDQLTAMGKLKKLSIKNGAIWTLVNKND